MEVPTAPAAGCYSSLLGGSHAAGLEVVVPVVVEPNILGEDS